MSDLLQIIKDIYDSEINIQISNFYDNGFEIKIGDKINGYKYEGWIIHANNLIPVLREKIIKYYPNSEFAKKYK